MIEKVNLLLKEMQDESTNSGGYYHFSKIPLRLEKDQPLEVSLVSYLSKIEAYKNPYLLIGKEKEKVKIADRDLTNLILKPIVDLEKVLLDKLLYWKIHETTLDARSKVTENYNRKEEEFKKAFWDFISKRSNYQAYLLEGIDTYHSFGKDQVNDDILIETEGELFVLHFGWSS